MEQAGCPATREDQDRTQALYSPGEREPPGWGRMRPARQLVQLSREGASNSPPRVENCHFLKGPWAPYPGRQKAGGSPATLLLGGPLLTLWAGRARARVCTPLPTATSPPRDTASVEPGMRTLMPPPLVCPRGPCPPPPRLSEPSLHERPSCEGSRNPEPWLKVQEHVVHVKASGQDFKAESNENGKERGRGDHRNSPEKHTARQMKPMPQKLHLETSNKAS